VLCLLLSLLLASPALAASQEAVEHWAHTLAAVADTQLNAA
jgi:hypothetical protein